jgi:WD40 repeat protein
LGAQAQLQLAENPDPVLGTLLAAESLRRFHTIEGDIPLRRGLELLSWQKIFTAPLSGCGGVTNLSADGQLLAVYSRNCRYNDRDVFIKVWNIATGQEIATLDYYSGSDDTWSGIPFEGAQLSPDGRWVITEGYNTIRLWDATTGQLVKEMTEASGAVFSPNSRWLAVQTTGNTVSVFDTSTLEPVAQMIDDNEITLRQFSLDSRLLATTAASGNLQLWNPSTGQQITQIKLGSLKVGLVQFSTDGQLLATTGLDTLGVQIWDIATTQALTQTAYGVQVASLAFSPDNHWLITTGNGAQVWNLNTGLEVTRLAQQARYPVNSVAFSPDGRWLATGSKDTLRVWEVGTWQETARAGVPADWVRFSADSKNLVTSSYESPRYVWRLAPDEMAVKTLSEEKFYKIAYSPDGRWLAAGGNSPTVFLWDAATLIEVAQLKHEDETNNFAFSPNSQWLATSSQGGTARIWEIATGREVSRQTYPSSVSVIAFSPDNQWLLVKVGQRLQVWEIATGQEVAHLDMTDKLFMAMNSIFSPDGRQVVTNWDNTLVIWEAVTGREVTRQRLSDWTPAPAFSPDGRLLALNGGVDKVAILDAATHQPLASLDHEGIVRALAFSPDGQRLATGTSFTDINWSGRGKTYLWDVATGNLIYELPSGPVDNLTFTRDGHWLATEGKIWEAKTGREIARLPKTSLYSAAFSADSRQLATIGWEGTPTQVWAWQASDLVAAACARLPRNLTRVEWRDYVGEEPYQATCPNLPMPEE